MSNWNGKHGKGAMRQRREQKRLEAEARQEACTDHGRQRETSQGYRLPNGANRSGVTKVHEWQSDIRRIIDRMEVPTS